MTISNKVIPTIFSFFKLLFVFVPQTIFSQEKPNVLFILIDDLRPSIGAYGDSFAITPNIDSLAMESLLYTNAYAQQALCNPSRASMLTGLRPTTTGIYDLEMPLRENLPNVVTLPQYFKNNGYQTVGFGKVFHGKLDDAISWSQPVIRPKVPGWKEPDNQQLVADGKNAVSYEFSDTPESQYTDAIVADDVIHAIEELKSRKYFIACGFVKPHLPFNAPAEYWNLYKDKPVNLPVFKMFPTNSPSIAHTDWNELRQYSDIPKKGKLDESKQEDLIRAYYSTVTYIDTQVGKIVKYLKKNNLYDNTLIILWGDHGYKLGEFGAWCKHTNYDIDTRVPLMIKIPGLAGRKVTDIVESIDIFKTLVDYYGYPLSQQQEGSNLLGELNPNSFAMSFMLKGQILGQSVRTKRYRFVKWGNDFELYDFMRFGETQNLNKNQEYTEVINYFNDFIINKEYKQSEECLADDINVKYSDLILSPNPASDTFKVQIVNNGSESSISRVKIYSLTGSLVRNINAKNSELISITTEGLLSGVYIVEAQSNEITMKGRIIVVPSGQ